MELAAMTKDEKSLLIYLETRMVDYAGTIDFVHLNDADNIILAEWKAAGFITLHRLTYKSIQTLNMKSVSSVIMLSDEAWELAWQCRKERANRLLSKPPYCDLQFVV